MTQVQDTCRRISRLIDEIDDRASEAFSSAEDARYQMTQLTKLLTGPDPADTGTLRDLVSVLKVVVNCPTPELVVEFDARLLEAMANICIEALRIRDGDVVYATDVQAIRRAVNKLPIGA